MTHTYYYGEVKYPPNEPKKPEDPGSVKTAIETTDGKKEVLVKPDHFEDVEHLEQGDTIVVIEEVTNEGVYYDVALPGYPEKAKEMKYRKSVNRLADLYHRFKDAAVNDDQAAQKLAVTAYLS